MRIYEFFKRILKQSRHSRHYILIQQVAPRNSARQSYTACYSNACFYGAKVQQPGLWQFPQFGLGK